MTSEALAAAMPATTSIAVETACDYLPWKSPPSIGTVVAIQLGKRLQAAPYTSSRSIALLLIHQKL